MSLQFLSKLINKAVFLQLGCIKIANKIMIPTFGSRRVSNLLNCKRAEASQKKKLREELGSVQYLSVISDPPDVGDRSHLAGPQNSSQVHFLIPHRHKGSREMDILQLTYSGTHIHHRVNSMHCTAMCKKRKKQQLYRLKWRKKG